MIPTNSPSRLILASSSAYRRELLARLRLPFAVMLPELDERPLPAEAPQATALRLARAKAEAVAARAPGSVVIGSDQVATLDGEQIGKPGSHAAALAQLQRMRGRRVVFHTALCVVDAAGGAELENVQTFVTFRDLPDAELDAYLRIEQPYDCAGSAKNEGLGIAILERIDSSDPTALTGLPLIALTGMLRRAGFHFFSN
ncbi:Maf family nucleotide pyrophosphatase [Massilia sp. PAMC28688]|uniref:Maf family nucleotide pyrophosphatase n=1 Tax=Massilia sp. PAMC28688 TaxID=2861283 RepID=UPI001C631446|nr:Maf family nucleotide pyrophosphatase [Massilia sp. PAMC28688]QYF92562.1 Maf family nucleotide pyrophosphatase [Massilia sp. PAMC28688]